MAVTLRNTGIQSSSTNSYTVSWPSGTVAGDMAVIMGGHGFGINTPSGWTSIDNETGANWNGAAFYKILTSGDITTGSVTVGTAGSFNGVFGIATIETTTFSSTIAPQFVALRSGTGASSESLTAQCKDNNDLMLYFGSNRGASNNTVSIGSSQQTINATNASGCLYDQASARGNPNPTYNYSSAGSGNYQIAITIAAPTTVPAFVRGTGIQNNSTAAASFTVNWPSGTASGDMAVIIYGGTFQLSSTPTGWTSIDTSSGSGWNGSVIYRVLNSTDISTGNVTLTPSSSAKASIAITSVIGSQLTGYNNPTATTTRNSATANTRTVSYTAGATTDYVLYFGSSDVTGTPTFTCDCSLGNFQTDADAGSNIVGCLYAGQPASSGTISPLFTYYTSTGGVGDYQAAVDFQVTPGSVATASGAGAASGVSLTGLVSVGSISGAGAASGVSLQLNSSVGSAAGAGAASGVTNVGMLSVGSAAGAGVASAVTNENIYSVGIASGSGTAFGTGVQQIYVVGQASGQAFVRGIGTGIGRILPFDTSVAWSINIYGKVIQAAGYDPLTFVLRVYYVQPGLTIDIGRLPISVTNAIEMAPNPEAYILQLVLNYRN